MLFLLRTSPPVDTASDSLLMALLYRLCIHFKMSRVDLFSVIKIKKLTSFNEIMSVVGVGRDSQGCEICKPAMGSILSSLYNEFVMLPQHHGNQETNDRSVLSITLSGLD